MNLFSRRCSSVRVRLTLWNTLTFALVLITLGLAFRIVAERYLLDTLDREIRVQANRFQESHQVEMIVVGDTLPRGEMRLDIQSSPPGSIHLTPPNVNPYAHGSLEPYPYSRSTLSLRGKATQYKIVQKIGRVGVPVVDQSGQFLYRSFDLAGKPLSPFALPMPFGFAFLNGEKKLDEQKQLETYRPWDKQAFLLAAGGNECFSTADVDGSSLRVFSLPLREEDKTVGVVQIAAPLGQVSRDIAGLTHILLFVLPLALLVAAGAGIFLTERAMRPVKSLTLAATGISPNQLSQRLPVSGADEFDELAATFNRALDRVEFAFLQREKMMEQLRRFTGDASHELRTPLTTIKTNTGVALAEEQPSQEHIHALRQIDRAADRMTSLVQDLLLLARSDAGQLSLDLHPLSLKEILNEAIEMFAGRSHAPIILHELHAGLTIRGDADHLCRLFLNLLENAVRHTPEEGQIDVILKRQVGRAIVCVQDTGCGVAPEHLPHLGERFYRADAGRNRKQGGAGLGLAICRSIVISHQGEMRIESNLGQGTTVTISLPLTLPLPE